VGTRQQPSLAERARNAVASARGAMLLARQIATGERCFAVVAVDAAADGAVVVALDCQSPLTRTLAVRPVVTVSVPARPPYETLQVTGAAGPVSSSHDGLATYRAAPIAVRFLGRRGNAIVPVDEYLCASPDALARDAPSIVHHLELAHTADLLACIAADGHADARAVVPRHLDSRGLEVSVITDAGVESVELAFPDGPVTSLDEVAVGLRTVLSCRCAVPDAEASDG
jgi:hypothetical protein